MSIKKISQEDMTELFADMAQNAPWDSSKPLLWGYFFADQAKAKLEQAAPLLVAKGYRVVGLFDSAAQADGTPAQSWLHVEKVEKHDAASLHARNQEFYRFAEVQQIETYDGMDVGPAV